ncbi:MAG TPA: OmpA family protein [Pseudomonadales bacterium]|nr:OmpA family protein [Pseudomonadales bacterium]
MRNSRNRSAGKSTALGLAVALASIGTLAQAAERTPDTGWYLGANIGQSSATIDGDGVTAGLLGQGFTVDDFDDEDQDVGFKLFGGYQFSKYIAVEGGYFDLGKFGFDAVTTPAGTYEGNIEVSGINLDLVLMLPVTEKFTAFGRAGVTYARSDDSFRGTGFIVPTRRHPSDEGADMKYGLGLQYDFTESFSMRAEAERYRIDDAVADTGDMDLFSVGLLFKLGRTAAPSRVASAPIAAAPAPEPEVQASHDLVVVPVVSKRQEYCSILDLQFEINVDDLQRRDEEELAVVGTFMNKYPDTTALIRGHTDNVGSPAANLRLSQRRADGVVAYLTRTFDIAPARLKAEGHGAEHPIADNRTQDGKRLNRRIDAVIACATDIAGLTVQPARVVMALAMEFDTNKADVRPRYRDELTNVAKFMADNPEVTATVEGHTSNLQGAPSQDMELSRRRAETVVTYLVDQLGVDRSRLTAEGFGHTREVAYNTSVEGKQDNRRVNIIFDFPKAVASK